MDCDISERGNGLKTKEVSDSRLRKVLEQISIFVVPFDEARHVGTLRHDLKFFGASPGQRGVDKLFGETLAAQLRRHESVVEDDAVWFASIFRDGGDAVGV